MNAMSWLDEYPIWCGLSTAVVMSEPMKTVNSPDHLHCVERRLREDFS